MLRSSEAMHAYLIDQVNQMLRRLAMFGGEPALWTVFHHLFLLEDTDSGMADLHESWRARNAFTPTGIKGALQRHLPDGLHSALPSMYAEAARQRGWLRLDRTLTDDEYAAVRSSIGTFVAENRTWHDVEETFGPPSVLFGGTNPLYEKTLAYGTQHTADPMIFFHLWNGAEPGSDESWPPSHPEPILLAVRYGDGPFAASFSFTPDGLRHHPPQHEG
ncbi:hypothetical protein DFR70_107338 [Nocardia tenerifensis]|uniref:Uncharacterized protein n=1 Tax=Nocardia tenerifensis TaxID=228006 RepID=A0A318KBQ4_9NOCA|nr:hypothetical protein [Nocardia tenerifensis]PXX62469.1 hypothetical protein DFR70_107338 [Nocardia tenerifensis]